MSYKLAVIITCDYCEKTQFTGTGLACTIAEPATVPEVQFKLADTMEQATKNGWARRVSFSSRGTSFSAMCPQCLGAQHQIEQARAEKLALARAKRLQKKRGVKDGI